jgi:hypothetical protein
MKQAVTPANFQSAKPGNTISATDKGFVSCYTWGLLVTLSWPKDFQSAEPGNTISAADKTTSTV